MYAPDIKQTYAAYAKIRCYNRIGIIIIIYQHRREIVETKIQEPSSVIVMIGMCIEHAGHQRHAVALCRGNKRIARRHGVSRLARYGSAVISAGVSLEHGMLGVDRIPRVIGIGITLDGRMGPVGVALYLEEGAVFHRRR